jgi:hypothetical protein
LLTSCAGPFAISLGAFQSWPKRESKFRDDCFTVFTNREIEMGARHELNRIHILGSVGIAVLTGVITSSWLLFWLMLGFLIVLSLCTGQIRPHSRGGRRKEQRDGDETAPGKRIPLPIVAPGHDQFRECPRKACCRCRCSHKSDAPDAAPKATQGQRNEDLGHG